MSDLSNLHVSLARLVLVGRALEDVLSEITTIARGVMPGTDAASITLIRGDNAYTAAYDGQLALDADELQYQRGYGPCMDAARASQVFLVQDMANEERWPDYCRHAAEQGARASLSIPLPFQGVSIGALNTYAKDPRAYGAEDLVLGEEIAAWIAVAVGNAEGTARTLEELEQMRSAMVSRASIEQAKGILMERYRVSEDQAFKLLTHASQHTNTKLRLVADELVRTGALQGADPDSGTARHGA
ncbi:GAF and ANTAR domain-containing protein [Auraticoccus monumenti]|uniref:GAF domain-containing protein n=1 Tax=Auraticoccus monumenti TaxID=675864 RepID=A0A1G7CM30_9ACTN|nr:GAF and ANTAR domain-containing protein [Auraticoccus monumenti]SDE40291.1 GAF domain-containing protein [Auraticoccus monumenti]